MGLLALIVSRFTQEIKSCERLGEQVSRDLLQTAQHPFQVMAKQIYHHV